MGTEPSSGARLGCRLAAAGLIIAGAAAAAMVFSGIGYRLGLWHFRTGFTILRWAFWFASAGALLSAAGLILTRGRPAKVLVAGLIGIAVGGGAAYIPWNWMQTAASLPYIHDITTDVQNPPQFVAVKGLRKGEDHPVDYDGPEVAAQQKEAYPDLAPLVTHAPREKVFEAAQAVLKSMGLELVDANPAEGRIEATATSLLYGFKDDVVVRIVPEATGARVDVRSKSRVGRSDLGQNARRIRTFLQKLQTSLG